MSTGKKLIVLVILIAVGFGLIYFIQQSNLNKAIRDTQLPELTNGLLPEPETMDGLTYLVPSNYVFDYGAEVPALDNPEYVSTATADEVVADDLPGIAIEVDGEHYFYPYQVMNWHVVVNETFGDLNLAITFDPLTYTDRVYISDRLEHAEKVYDNNAVLVDEAGTLWSQSRGLSIVGEEGEVNQTLETYPYESVKWKVWRDEHPGGQVLSFETGHVRDYTRHPFSAYDENNALYFPISADPEGTNMKWVLDGVEVGGEAVMFLRTVMEGRGVSNGNIGGTDAIALYDFEDEITRLFHRTVDGQVLTFAYDFNADEIIDAETESLWNANGLAIDGELEGTQLERIEMRQYFWFYWQTEYPESRIAEASIVE